jgi:predicted TIM-barrel fold metal-dependent hydrolase
MAMNHITMVMIRPPAASNWPHESIEEAGQDFDAVLASHPESLGDAQRADILGVNE